MGGSGEMSHVTNHIFGTKNRQKITFSAYFLFDRPNIVARFEYQRNGKKAKKPIRNQIIYFSKTYEFNENTMRDVMVHEMIHYYTAWNRIKDNGSHGRQFWRIAKEFSERYGLNITIKVGTPLPDKPPGFLRRLFNLTVPSGSVSAGR